MAVDMQVPLSWAQSSQSCRRLLCAVLVFITGCAAPFVAEKNDARDFLDESLPIGTHRNTAVSFLRTREFHFNMFTPAQCQGFVVGPRFQCRGGSALFVTLEPEIWSWRSPFYHPALQSFLAFDADERLVESIVFLEGRD